MLEQWLSFSKAKLTDWTKHFFQMLPNLVIAVGVFATFLFVGKYLRRLLNRLLLRLTGKDSVSGLFSSIFYILFLLVGLFVSLELVHLEKTVSTLLAGAGIIGLALGFAFQDLTANFISGVFIIFRRPFETGNIVDTNGFIGTVEEIQLRSTTIRTYQGLHVILPNKDIFQKPITNYSRSEERRIDIVLSIKASNDTSRIEETIRDAMKDIPQMSTDRKTEVIYTDYPGDKVKVEIWCWINNSRPLDFVYARHHIIRQVHEALLAAGIKE